jgi:hypothetical protein
VDESASTPGLVIFEVTNKLAAILPEDGASALPASVFGPLSRIVKIVVHFEQPSVLYIRINFSRVFGVKNELAQFVLGDLNSTILNFRNFINFLNDPWKTRI